MQGPKIPIERKVEAYLGSCVQVQPTTAINLITMGESLFLYLFRNDPMCQRLSVTLLNYLKHEHIERLILAVEATDQVLIRFGISILPQIRYFVNGMENCRIHGTMDYHALSSFFDSLKVRFRNNDA